MFKLLCMILHWNWEPNWYIISSPLCVSCVCGAQMLHDANYIIGMTNADEAFYITPLIDKTFYVPFDWLMHLRPCGLCMKANRNIHCTYPTWFSSVLIDFLSFKRSKIVIYERVCFSSTCCIYALGPRYYWCNLYAATVGRVWWWVNMKT